MALTNNNLEIIKALAKNDMHAAKIAALASLNEDQSKKNKDVVAYYKKLLAANASVLMSSLPADLQTILVGEVPEGFDPNRYLVRESDRKVIEDISMMRLIAAKLAEKKIPYKNTTLLYGESGTGKTELGRYIAHKLHLPFFYISFSSAIDSYMGSTAKNIHKVFAFCNAIPCVLMLDEVDCVAARRNAGGSRGVDGELERTTISLMQELDRLPNHVTLIAATNRLDMVDEALMRRFSIRHEIENMLVKDLIRLINRFLEATGTERYVTEDQILYIACHSKNPGQVMPELYKAIGKAIFEEQKETLTGYEEEDEKPLPELWAVTYTWKTKIAAATEADAIALARQERSRCYGKAAEEQYTAKRAEYIYTNPQ